MYQVARWRYWVVFVVLAVGTLLALPNFFGEEPAIQVTRDDRGQMDEATNERVLEVLKAQNIAYSTSYTEEDRLVVRIPNVDDQIRARDAISDSAPGEYIVALTSASRTPALLRSLGLKPMSLGLDLRGGVHFMYEVDIASAIEQSLQRLAQDVRARFREQRIPYQSVTVRADSVEVLLRPEANASSARKLIQGDDPGVSVTQDEVQGATRFIVGFTPEYVKQRQDLAIEQNVTTLRNRVNELGVSEPFVARQGLDRITVQLPGIQDPNQAIRVLGATATVEFRLVDEANNPYEARDTKRIPLGSKLYTARDGSPVLLKRELIASGDQLTDATTSFTEGTPAVSVTLNARAGASMLKATQENLGRRMAVVYIEKKRLEEGEHCKGTRNGNECTEEEAISVATIQGVFSSRFQITGLSAVEAQELALLLRAGSLATPIFLVEQRTIGPSLGADNIKAGIIAMAVGAVLTFIFLAVYYSAFGMIANIVLICNVVLLVAAMSLLQASLSLPGIAGIVLTIGMAADANVLIYERIREELRNGSSPQASIHAGFDKAFSAIADSNITTLLAGVVLFAFGTGPIKGFAVTLVIGIFTSLFSAIMCSRVFLDMIWGRRKQLTSLPV
jgi:preprotein translocase subunit SecD